MPDVRVHDITMHYEQDGTGEPLVLIPYLAADNACYAFQVADYAKEFTCISVDLRGSGVSDKPAGTYTTQLYADDVAGLMEAIGVERAHVMGLSLGASTSMWLAAKYPAKVKSLSLHSSWTKSDPFLKTVVGGWQVMARALPSVADMIIQGIFPWCYTPELYATKPEYIDSLSDFVRGRPAQPLDAFLRQTEAVLSHDVEAQLHAITAPTQITYGRYDLVTSTRFLPMLTSQIHGAEVVIFEGCAHAPIYEKVQEFNQTTLDFLRRQSG
jgi:pimeloyl-ACP methyl ester carboxylesterase